MTPKNTIYVSGINGSPTGTGAINDPIDTIAAGVLLAEAASTSDSTRWEVRILAGLYDEPIIQSIGANTLQFTLTSGAGVIFSGLGGTVTAVNTSILLYMEQGSLLGNVGGGAVVDAQVNDVAIYGFGKIDIESSYAGIEVSNFGTCTLRGIEITNTSGSTAEAILQTAGTLNMTDCTIVHDAAVAAIQKNGGDTKLYSTNIYAPSSTNYVDAASPQDVQVVFCQSNVAAGVNVTETVQAMSVDAAFII